MSSWSNTPPINGDIGYKNQGQRGEMRRPITNQDSDWETPILPAVMMGGDNNLVTREENEPSQSLKLYNQKEGPGWKRLYPLSHLQIY